MKEFYRKATDEELQFYYQELYPLQDKVFEIATVYDDKLYLTGGTALSRFYFNHRLSEDLDFFTTTADLRYIANDLAGRLNDAGFVIEIEALEIYFARFYIVNPDYRLKVEFVREYNLTGALTKTAKGIFVNDLNDIGANKITAFEDRTEIKDVIDLYYLTQKVSLENLFVLADKKRMPVAYENLLGFNTTGISGRVLITQDLDEQKLTDFVNHLKLKTELEVKKKEKVALKNIQGVVEKLLWDFPREDRNINTYSTPVLKRRLSKLKLPERLALQKVLP